MGSVYLILATNLGARLGFLVALTGLAGWMFLMGIMWAIYGIGLRGKDPTWDAVPGRTVLQDTQRAVHRRRVRERDRDPGGRRRTRSRPSSSSRSSSPRAGRRSAESDTQFGQAASAAATFLEETGRVRGRRVQGRQRVRHRRRPLPDDRRLRPAGVLARAALRRRRGRPARADAHRAGPRPGGGRDRRRRASTSTCTWSATSAPGANRRSCCRSAPGSSSSSCAGCCTAASGCS